MTKQQDLTLKSYKKMIEKFGKTYMGEKIANGCCHAWSYDGDYFELFCGFDGNEKTNKWTEFAYVRVHKETGEAEFLDYGLPDGTRMKKPIKKVKCA